jgi:DNA repair protein RecO (recombination protein O)
MIHKTKGIFLRQVPYSETSVIAGIYTREFGLKSFILKGAKSKKAAVRSNLFHPCALLDLVIQLNEKSSLNFIKELRLLNTESLMNVDLPKLSIKFFLSEVFSKSIREEEANPQLFDFLELMLEDLESREKGVGIFPSLALVKLTKHLGFDIYSRLVSAGLEEETGPLSTETKDIILKLATSEGQEDQLEQYPREVKKELLNVLLKYYRAHIPTFGESKTLKVLEEIL